MSCTSNSAVLYAHKPEDIERQIAELYKSLKNLNDEEDDGDSDKVLKAHVEKFEKFFEDNKKMNFEKLLDIPETIDFKGECLLFRAMSIPAEKGSPKYNALKSIIDLLIRKCPEMIKYKKKSHESEGITPIHVAILKGDTELLLKMAECIKNMRIDGKSVENEVKCICANGPVFQNTVMMAGTFLGTAALKCNWDLFYTVLHIFSTGLDQKNKKEDNIVHSLIKYAHAQPSKSADALGMLRRILKFDFRKASDKSQQATKSEDMTEENEKRNAQRKRWELKVRKLLMMQNKENLTPLQLAAKRQQFEFFVLLMEQKVYCSSASNNGLVNENVYDITEIETVRTRGVKDENVDQHENIRKEYHESVLEYLVHHRTESAFRFADFLPVKEVIKEKWQFYRYRFWGLMVVHLIYMICLSVSAVFRSKYKVTFEQSSTENIYVTTVSTIGLVLSLIYFALEVIRIYIGRFTYKSSPHIFKRLKLSCTSPYSNYLFRRYFFMFYSFLFADFIVAAIAGQGKASKYRNESLIFAVIIGWYLFMFFLQGFKPFSFFTVLIQRVITDMIKFAIVMSIFLIAFSVAMFIIMQDADTDDEDFSEFHRTMVKMFTIMIGISDLEILFKAKQPALAIIVFALFVLLTTILLLNALIAMMSNSCTELMSNTGGIVAMKMHCRLQKLSIILFLENYLPRAFCKETGEVRKVKRYVNNEWTFDVERRFWSLSSVRDHRTDEIEDLSDHLGLDTMLYKHKERKPRNSRKNKKVSVSPDITLTYGPDLFSTKRIDITDTNRKFCESCHQTSVLRSNSVEITQHGFPNQNI